MSSIILRQQCQSPRLSQFTRPSTHPIELVLLRIGETVICYRNVPLFCRFGLPLLRSLSLSALGVLDLDAVASQTKSNGFPPVRVRTSADLRTVRGARISRFRTDPHARLPGGKILSHPFLELCHGGGRGVQSK